MVVSLKIKKSGKIIYVQIKDVQDVKKSKLKGFFKDFDVLVLSDNDECVVYPIKNILEINIKKED